MRLKGQQEVGREGRDPGNISVLQSIGLGNGSDWNEKGESWLQELKNKLHLFVKELVWKSADNLQGQFSLGSQLLSSDLTASASSRIPGFPREQLERA